MRKAVYAGSFDPVTNGHLWMIEVAAKLFDQLIIAVAQNVDKEYTFSLDERIAMLRDVTCNLDNVVVTHFDHEFLVNYAKKQGAKYIVRGIRNNADYEYEKTIRYVNSDLSEQIETVFLIPPRNFAEVSSSLVKGLIGTNQWETIVQNYLPNAVFKKMVKWDANKKS